jgi:glycosyltransferase involved in cell wall biosynthesis
MKRVVMLDQLDFSSGLGRYVRDAFVAKGIEVLVVNPRDAFWPKVWPALSCFCLDRKKWYERRWRAGLFSVAAWKRNSRICSRMLEKVLRPDDRILQLQTHYRPDDIYSDRPYFMYLMYAMSLSLGVPGIPWVPSVEDQPEFLRLEGDLIRRAKHVFTIADYTTRHMVETVGADRSKVTTAGCGGADFFLAAEPPSVPCDLAYTLLFVGWDFELKGGRDLIPAFKLARERIPNLRLIVAGPDPAVVGNHPGVEAIGGVHDRNQLLELYRKADLFVLPSVFDSFGFVFVEAMSQYLPCIGTDFQAMPEIIEHGKTGYVVPLRNPSALADAICQFYGNKENRRQMGVAARARALSRFRWDGVVDRMIETMWEA